MKKHKTIMILATAAAFLASSNTSQGHQAPSVKTPIKKTPAIKPIKMSPKKIKKLQPGASVGIKVGANGGSTVKKPQPQIHKPRTSVRPGIKADQSPAGVKTGIKKTPASHGRN